MTDASFALALPDERATARLAGEIAGRARRGDVIALAGPLGSGKTSFARAFIRARSTTAGEVPSPTFALVEIYEAEPGPAIWHFDLFRLAAPEEVWELGIEDAFASGISLIEWPERLGPLLPGERLEIALAFATAPKMRVATIAASAAWAGRLAGLPMAERGQAVDAFLAAAGWGDAARQPLPGDASFRRYVRLIGEDRRAMLMDAPPPREDVRPFLAVARLLHRIGLSAPRSLAEDTAAGLLLLEDFGDDTYTRLLAAGAEEGSLYALAIDVLIAIGRRFAPDMAPALPPYDEARLLAEAALLVEWYLPAVAGAPVDPGLRESYLALWRGLLKLARAVPETLVLRDFHVDNLMRLPGRDGTAACGLLDFQDAVLGPVSYDLVSLLADARRDVPAGLARAMRDRFLAAFPAIDRDAFDRSCAVLGAQRNCKIVGIFTRLSVRDGKPAYLPHIPRVWRLIEADLHHPDLAPLKRWLDRHIPPAARHRP